MMFAFQIDAPWRDFITFGPGFVALIMILACLMKMAPTWKEVKMRELELRSNEVLVRGQEAEALTALSEVLRAVAVEQRRATDTIDILQRVNSDANDRLSQTVTMLHEQIGNIPALTRRVETLEKHVESQSTTA